MRIVCWNTEHKRASWRFLCERHREADVALLQEACTPPGEVAGRLDVGPGPWRRAVPGVAGSNRSRRS